MHSTAPPPSLPASHVGAVLGRSRARLQRQARLHAGLSLALWANRDDEVGYSRQGHHTLSVYLAGGHGSQLQGQPQALGAPGRYCVLPAEHESRWLVRAPVQFLHLYISDLAWADRVVRLLDAEPRSRTLAPAIYAQDACYDQWAQSLWRLDWASEGDALLADTLSQQVLDRLVLQSATPRQRQALQRPLGGLSAAARCRVLEHVEAHLADSGALTLTALAQVAHLSEYHFARMFRQSMGCTVHAWVLWRRVERARQALAAPGQPPRLELLAQACGFSSASHLVRCFRAQAGVTPAQFAQWRRSAARASGIR
ncbi:MAG: helix-turn-helix domain-containing protein [Comamonas sp.]